MAPPPRLAHLRSLLSPSSSSHSLPSSALPLRSYATITPYTPPPPPKRPHDPTRTPYHHPLALLGRQFPARKSFSYRHLSHLLATNPLVLLLGHENLSVALFSKFRRELARAVNPPPRGSTRLVADTPQQAALRKPEPRVHVIRPAILGALLKDKYPHMHSVREVLKGPVAALVYPTVDPVVLAGMLRALDRAVPKSLQTAKDSGGGKVKPPPRLQLLAALVDGQVLGEERTREVSRLPTLEVLRSQIVGLISSPAGQIRGVLEQARGGRQVRLLESYVEQLGREGEEGQKEKSGS